jgi:UDP-N-acetylmuramoyl-tripeptide--D-alanyl-D-alanine ligase
MNERQFLDEHQLSPVSIAPLMGAQCLRPSNELITNVQIDSRSCAVGSLFFALAGERVDGFSYIAEATARGAVAVVVDQKRASDALRLVETAVLVVEDPLTALHTLARSYLALLDQVTVIGITGSVGKTTTKEALAAILAEDGSTAKTPGNYNSVYGLPLSLFTLSRQAKWGVFEMGIDHVGEMDRLVDTLRPSWALLTNVGISHLEKFKSVATIATEKSKIFHPAIEGGFISRDCTHRSEIEARSPKRLFTYDRSDIDAIDLGLDGWRLFFKGESIAVRAVGRHLLEDVIGALKLADHLGIGAKTIARGLEAFEPMPGRSFVQRSGITIVDDSYNANPDSTSTILRYLSSLAWNGSKRAVLGSMKELGNQSRSAHRALAHRLAASSFTKTYLYGSEMAATKGELQRIGYGGQVIHTNDYTELEHLVESQTERGDLVLLKASRSVAIDRLIPTLQQRWGP